MYLFFFQAEDGIRDAQESRGLGDVYKRQPFDKLGVVRIVGAQIVVTATVVRILKIVLRFVVDLSLIHI